MKIVTRARLLHSDYSNGGKIQLLSFLHAHLFLSYLMAVCKAGIGQLRSKLRTADISTLRRRRSDERKLEWKLLLVATDRNLDLFLTCVENNLRLSIFLVKFEF